MKIKSIHLKEFKRFTDFKIINIPEQAKLVILIGPNGSGKTSLFEAFKQYSSRYGQTSINRDIEYLSKNLSDYESNWPDRIQINFHEGEISDKAEHRKAFYFRTAYRNESDFSFTNLNKVNSALDNPRIGRLIDNDSSISENYQRLLSQSVQKLFEPGEDDIKRTTLRDEIILEIRESMIRVFGDLFLVGPGNPLMNGSFYFKKGDIDNFHFKNLSGGEKAAFDLILDLIMKQFEFDNTIFCIDEPDLHLHTRLQGKLLIELYKLLKPNSQLWISTHSIGMMKTALELYKLKPQEIVFIDFHELNMDASTIIQPTPPTRTVWKRALEMALDDLSDLVTPRSIYLCEGSVINQSGKQRNTEFDARCYNKIFEIEYPDVEFISIGSSNDILNANLTTIELMKALSNGIEIQRILDRDDRSSQEIFELKKNKIHVLELRDLESYLLSDEIIVKLCQINNLEMAIEDALNIKKQAVADSILRGNPYDDIKSAAGQFFTEIKRLLSLTQAGNDTFAFLRDTMAPLLTPDTQTYNNLKNNIFTQ